MRRSPIDQGEGRIELSAPAIAGLPEWYVTTQLQKFRHGVRGSHPQDTAGMRMRPMARSLPTESDVQAVAQYVATLPQQIPPRTLTGDLATGEHRRVFNPLNFPGLASNSLQGLRVIATLALVTMLFFQLPFLFNFVYSMFRGPRAGRNPWQANTLEWVTASPPPHGNFEEWPEVYRPPYEYSVPGRADDYWPQHVKA